MPHRTSSTRNDYERKINYDWPYYLLAEYNITVNYFSNISNKYKL